ncbi:E3 ubiquitin-protein ligase RNF10-like [Diadema setosum]|uniref:E3 ubiquitin-protein ligase RNF10-like n=1 Tax=Diadema setosum TaxID=31175 RepID=UPI003B3AA7AF
MAKEGRDMEKKIVSSPARLTSCESKSKENGRGNGNKAQRHNNRSRRDLPQGRSPADPASGQSRRPVPQKSRAMDKRPRNRGLPASRRDEVTVNQRAEFGSALPQGPKKINLNHLINFTFSPRDTEESRGAWRGRARWGHRHPRFNKDHFLQANCQFVVKSSGDYVRQCVDPDALVDWDMIEQVRMLGHEMPSCPICLFPPAAAKITKCGHIYCWPCILHYLSLGEKKWRKCPICYDSVVASDLKSVVAKSLKTFSVGDQITMRLMRREKGSVIVQPHDPGGEATEAAPTSPILTDIQDNTSFAKLMVASPEQVRDVILLREKQELEKQLKESNDDFEKSFIQRALDSWNEREASLNLCDKTARNVSTTSEKEDIPPATQDVSFQEDDPDVTRISLSPKEDAIVYASAFSDEEVDEADAPAGTSPDVTLPGSDDSSPLPAALDGLSLGAGEVEGVTTETSGGEGGATEEKEPSQDEGSADERKNSLDAQEPGGSGAKEEDKDEEEEDAAENSGAAASAMPESSSPSGRDRKMSGGQSPYIYFYQAEDGQHLYLGSLNARCLIHEYGSLEKSPLTITGKLIEMEHMSITQDTRNRLRHLQHLPLTCDIGVCELDLAPPTLSPATLAAFASDIQKKQQRRDKKARDEKRRERKMKLEEDRKNGKFPRARYSLQSARQFPSCGNSPPGSAVTADYQSHPSAPPLRPISPAASVDSAASNFSTPLSDSHDEEPQHVDIAARSPPAEAGIWGSPSGGAVGGWPAVGSQESQGGQRSFAQMLRDGSAKPVSPMKPATHSSTSGLRVVGGSTNKTPGRETTSSNESDNEDYVPVPQYKDAFSNAIQDALDRAAQNALKKDAEPDGESGKGSGGRKNRKGRKKQLLFSTAGPRFK